MLGVAADDVNGPAGRQSRNILARMRSLALVVGVVGDHERRERDGRGIGAVSPRE